MIKYSTNALMQCNNCFVRTRLVFSGNTLLRSDRFASSLHSFATFYNYDRHWRRYVLRTPCKNARYHWWTFDTPRWTLLPNKTNGHDDIFADMLDPRNIEQSCLYLKESWDLRYFPEILFQWAFCSFRKILHILKPHILIMQLRNTCNNSYIRYDNNMIY